MIPRIAYLNGIFRATAAKVAVQSPVNGSGSAVNRKSANAPYFAYLSLTRRSARLTDLSITRVNHGAYFSLIDRSQSNPK